jgi:hypothetical protein
MKSQSGIAKLFIGLMALGGLVSLSYGLLQVHPWHHALFGTLLVLAMLASRLNLQLPGLRGNMSVNLPFFLIAVAELSLFEALLVVVLATAAQCFPKGGGKPKLVQMLFNVSTAAIAVSLAGLMFQGRMPMPTAWLSGSLLLSLAAASFFLTQTLPVATIISLTESRSVLRIWSSIFHLSFPYYVLSAGVTSLVTTVSHRIGWQIPLFAFPAMYGVYRSYRLYFGQAATLSCTAVLAKAAGTMR